MNKQDELEMLIRIDTKVKELHKCVFGNGQPGIYKEHQVMKVQHDECMQRKEQTQKKNDRQLKIYVGIATVLSPSILKIIEAFV